MKWLAAARLNMRWLQVMSTLQGAAWNKATDLAHFLTEAASYICSSGEWSADTVMLFLWLVLGSRSRFTKLRGTIDRWRCSRCQRFARNKLTLAALKKDGLCRTVWCRARGCSINSESALVLQGSTFCAGPTAQTAALRCVTVAQEHVPLTQRCQRTASVGH